MSFLRHLNASKKATAAGDDTLAALQIKQLRLLVGINLLLGLTVVVVASGGRYWAQLVSG